MRHVIALIGLIVIGCFFGFDELWKIMSLKDDKFGTPTCSNEYI